MFALRTESMPRSQLYEKNLFVPGMLTRYVCRASRSLWLITEKRFKTANTSRRLSRRTFPQKQRHKQSVFKQRHKRFYTQTPLQFTDNFFYTEEPFLKSAFTQNFYTKEFLQGEFFAQKNFYTQKNSLTKHFTQSSFYTQMPLHIETFTHRNVYTKKIHRETLHTEAFTQKCFDTQMILHTQKLLHGNNLTHRHFLHRFYTQKVLDTDAFKYIFFTEEPLHKAAFTNRRFYTERPLHRPAFTHTHSYFFTDQPLHRAVFTHSFFPTSVCGVLMGSCFWLCTPGRRPSRPSPSVTFRLTHNSLTQLTHPQLSHTQLSHAQLTHTHKPNPLTYSLTQLSHTQHSHNTHTQHSCTTLSRTTLHTQLSHTQLTHTQQLSQWHARWPRMAGVALGDALRGLSCGRRGTWHAWHLWRWAGSGDALGRGWSVVTLRSFAWQVWHLVPSTVTWYGRRGTWWDRPSLLVWQAWHYNNGLALVTRLVAPGPPWCRGLLSGRCGTWWHRPSLCVACVALMALGWLWWRAWSRLVRRDARSFARQAWHLVASISTFTLHGRLGTYNNELALVTRSVAWSAVTPKPFAWQAWHLVTPTVTLYSRRGTWWHLTFRLCGRHGAYHTDLALTRLVAVGPSCGRRGTWWHRPLHLVTSTLTLCGRRGTYGVGMALWRRNLLRGRRGTWLHPRSLCVASVALLAVGWLWYWPVSSHLPQSCLKHDRTEQVWAG